MSEQKINLATAKQQFVAYLKEKKRATATILAYSKDIDQLLSFLEKAEINDLKNATQINIESFLASLLKDNYTQKSISRKINSIKTLFRYLKLTGLIRDDPSTLIEHPRYEIKPPRILSKQEYRALRDACREDIRISAIVEILLQTGIRISELANLELNDLKDNHLFIKAYESHESREVPLNKPAKQALEKYLSVRPKIESNSVFVTKNGRSLLIRNIRTAIDRYFRIADIKEARVNDLRHTFIAHHLKEGTSLVLVSKLVGHKRLSTTEKYLELIKNQMDEKIKLGEL